MYCVWRMELFTCRGRTFAQLVGGKRMKVENGGFLNLLGPLLWKSHMRAWVLAVHCPPCVIRHLQYPSESSRCTRALMGPQQIHYSTRMSNGTLCYLETDYLFPFFFPTPQSLTHLPSTPCFLPPNAIPERSNRISNDSSQVQCAPNQYLTWHFWL